MTRSFYDELAPFHHLLYGDWEAAVRQQGAALAGLLGQRGVPRGSKVLDAACGIGTQALGLATHGYCVAASDISSGEIDRIRQEAASRHLAIDARIDDLRTLACSASGSLAAVLACDNSLPHLLGDDELLLAFRACLRVLRPGGLAVYSVRDYARVERKNPDVRPYGLRTQGEGRFLAVQAWEWDGDHYDLRMYLTQEGPDGACRTRVLVTRYYAVTIERLMKLMADAGFVSLERHDDVLFQPVILGRKAS